MKSVVLYYLSVPRNEAQKEIFKSINIFFSDNPNYKYQESPLDVKNIDLIKADVAIMFGVYSQYKHQNFEYEVHKRRILEKKYKNMIIIELGFINRPEYYSFSWDYIINYGKIPEFPSPIPTTRLDQLSLNIKPLNYNKKTEKGKEKHILYCGQIPWDAQIRSAKEYYNYTYKALLKIRKITKRPIIFRNHPLHKRNAKKRFSKDFPPITGNDLKKYGNITLSTKKTLEEEFENCYCVCAYNSTSLIEALYNGIPIITEQKSCVVYDIAENNINNIEKLRRVSPDKIIESLSRVAYRQWSLKEIEQGEPFKYYITK
jgi:hypothetical protein